MGELPIAKQHDQQLKEEAVQYYLDHKDFSLRGCSQNLGIGYSALGKWLWEYRSNDGMVPTRGFGNYASDVEKRECQVAERIT